jgi:predicted nucleic acid-binding protein
MEAERTIEETVMENLRVLPAEKKQEVLDFVEFLPQKTMTRAPRRNPIGLFADLKLDITDAEVALARRELWSNFPRDIETCSAVPEMPDRIIAATALYLGVPLVTQDLRIPATSLSTIW